jgi:hypothetical protein
MGDVLFREGASIKSGAAVSKLELHPYPVPYCAVLRCLFNALPGLVHFAHAAGALTALLEAAPKLPVTFIARCACDMYISAVRGLLDMDATEHKDALM